MLLFTIPETLYGERGKIGRANLSELSKEFS
jgi:hypothetical protein